MWIFHKTLTVKSGKTNKLFVFLTQKETKRQQIIFWNCFLSFFPLLRKQLLSDETFVFWCVSTLHTPLHKFLWVSMTREYGRGVIRSSSLTGLFGCVSLPLMSRFNIITLLIVFLRSAGHQPVGAILVLRAHTPDSGRRGPAEERWRAFCGWTVRARQRVIGPDSFILQ